MNFWLQIRGTKTAQLWDPADESVMTAAERDLLLSSRTRPPYRESFPEKALTFHLSPGVGVHISDTMLGHVDTCAPAQSQAPVGRNPRIDAIKATCLRSFRRAKSVLKARDPDAHIE